MTGYRPADYLASLVRELCALGRETERVEFKLNEALTSLMRCCRICEERGSGIDLVNEAVADKLRAMSPAGCRLIWLMGS